VTWLIEREALVSLARECGETGSRVVNRQAQQAAYTHHTLGAVAVSYQLQTSCSSTVSYFTIIIIPRPTYSLPPSRQTYTVSRKHTPVVAVWCIVTDYRSQAVYRNWKSLKGNESRDSSGIWCQWIK